MKRLKVARVVTDSKPRGPRRDLYPPVAEQLARPAVPRELGPCTWGRLEEEVLAVDELNRLSVDCHGADGAGSPVVPEVHRGAAVRGGDRSL
jgi:hypothetical protein